MGMISETMNAVNGAISFVCAVFSLLLIVALQATPYWRRIIAVKPMFLCMIFTFLTLLCDGIVQLFFMDEAIPFRVLLTASDFFSFLVEWCFGLFVVSLVTISAAMKRTMLTVLGLVCLTGEVLLVANCIHPFLFDFETGQYPYNGVYWGMAGFNYLFFFVAVLLLLFRGKNLSARDRFFLSVTPLLPLTSLLWDYLFPGLSSWYLMLFVTVSGNYIRLMFVTMGAAQEEVRRLEVNRTKATLERIKPHYIYNVLASIYYLCDQDVGMAKEAIHIFSDYLRNALNMMEAETLIPFSRELRTIRNYLELEQMRFGDRIRVRYQIEADEFLLPPFAVQPLVENSVKHGAEHAEEAGDIIIASFERENEYAVVIRDTFGGFDSEAEGDNPEGSATKYIRDILEQTVGGTLQVKSRPGAGTVSMISIPKKKDHHG